jgi:hypothetical protein
MYLDEASYADYIAAYKKFMLEVATVYVSNLFKETVSRYGSGEKYTFFIIKSWKHLKNPLYRPRTNHTGHQKQNPSRQTVPLKKYF